MNSSKAPMPIKTTRAALLRAASIRQPGLPANIHVPKSGWASRPTSPPRAKQQRPGSRVQSRRVSPQATRQTHSRVQMSNSASPARTTHQKPPSPMRLQTGHQTSTQLPANAIPPSYRARLPSSQMGRASTPARSPGLYASGGQVPKVQSLLAASRPVGPLPTPPRVAVREQVHRLRLFTPQLTRTLVASSSKQHEGEDIQQLEEKVEMMDEVVNDLVKERNFYYSKCLELENLCKAKLIAGESVELAREVMKVLVKADEGFEIPSEGTVYNEEDYFKQD